MINFICFIGEVNFTLQTGPALFTRTNSQGQDCYTTLLASHILFQDLSSFGSPTTIQNTMKDQQICNTVSNLVILISGLPLLYCGLFLWK